MIWLFKLINLKVYTIRQLFLTMIYPTTQLGIELTPLPWTPS